MGRPAGTRRGQATNDGLSGMPADGISLPPKKGGTSARPAGAGSEARLHQPRDWAEGGMAASGTRRDRRYADIDWPPAPIASEAYDPAKTHSCQSTANFAVVHNRS